MQREKFLISDRLHLSEKVKNMHFIRRLWVLPDFVRRTMFAVYQLKSFTLEGEGIRQLLVNTQQN
jgi:hypothetical protein